MGRLNNTKVAHAKIQPKEYNLADGDGLYLRVRPTGSKIWLFNYFRPYSKKRTNIGLGEYPDVKLADARKKVLDYRELLASDIDPKEHRDSEQIQKQEAEMNTFQAVAERWFEAHKEAEELTPDYAQDLINSLRNHVFPDLGKVPIHKVTAPKAISALQPLKRKGKYETIRRLCGRMNMIMDDAINTGIIPEGGNPLKAIHKKFKSPSKVAKHYPTIKPEKLPDLLNKIADAELNSTTRALFHFQLHTMTRPAEAAGAKWKEIDFENRLWRIPASRMKRKREHIVPLTPQTIDLLKPLFEQYGHLEHVFPSPFKPKNHISNETVNVMLKRNGYKGKLVSHGLRSIASTTLNENGHDAELIEVSLSHVDSNTSRKPYNRADYIERRKVLMAWWSDYITAAENEEVQKGKKHLKLAN